MKKITADSPEAQSANIISENIAKLKELFPEAFAEDGIDFDTLKQILGSAVAEKEEKYSFAWPGKRQARQIALTPSLGTLRPAPEESVDWDTTQNLFIEGDNLEVLKLLQRSYSGKVKIIYIDPPYNTGKDFIYPDNYRDAIHSYKALTGQLDEENRTLTSNPETSGRYHTDWLNMMYPRLQLARNLLREDGVIFISIDDTEVANLKKICDEIFYEENFIGTILWKKKTNGNNMGYIPPVHDYVIAYKKHHLNELEFGFPISQEYIDNTYKNPDNDPRGRWTTSDLSANHEGPYFKIVNPNTGQEHYPPEGRFWVFNEAEVKKRIEDGRIIFGKGGSSAPVQKKFLAGRVEKRLKAESWWDQHGMNEDGSNELSELFSVPKLFPHPKPSKMLQNICQIASRPDGNDIILDFFSGSGSIAHALIQLNKEDSGNRHFILIQLPEITFERKHNLEEAPLRQAKVAYESGYRSITEIGKERMCRVINKIKAEHPDYIGDLGFRVFKLDSSNIRPWNPDATDIAGSLLAYTDNLLPDRTEQDLLYEVLLKFGLDLSTVMQEKVFAGHTTYSMGQGVLFACLSKSIATEDVEVLALGIATWRKEANPVGESTVIFRDSAFAGDIAKANMTAILQQYGINNVRSL